jgi:hypothetical protein
MTAVAAMIAHGVEMSSVVKDVRIGRGFLRTTPPALYQEVSRSISCLLYPEVVGASEFEPPSWSRTRKK